jgi:hypothetical protein
MRYALIAFFLSTGDHYTERSNLSLQQCAGHAAMARTQAAELYDYIGEVRYLCLPEGR